MKQTFSILLCALILIISSNNVTAQGCVAVRQMGGITAIGCTNSYGFIIKFLQSFQR